MSRRNDDRSETCRGCPWIYICGGKTRCRLYYKGMYEMTDADMRYVVEHGRVGYRREWNAYIACSENDGEDTEKMVNQIIR